MATKSSLAELNALSPRALERRLRAGHPLLREDVAGFRYRGISLGMPRWFERLTWKKFCKVFVQDDERATVRGWNERVCQDDLEAPCRPRRPGKPERFGHFEVLAADDPDWLRGRLVLDYAAGHPAWHPLARLCDPLVALEPGSAERLLGCSRVALGVTRLPTPSYFLLEREDRVSTAVEPPCWRV